MIEERVIHLDMLIVDRLLAWAQNIETYGPDLSHVGRGSLCKSCESLRGRGRSHRKGQP